jgi:hypothetical protein
MYQQIPGGIVAVSSYTLLLISIVLVLKYSESTCLVFPTPPDR